MIANRILTRFPHIRWIVPHCGSFLPYMLSHFAGVSGILASVGMMEPVDAKAHGVTKAEIAAVITHATMYVGWSKGWAVFRLAKEIWNEAAPAMTEKDKYQNSIFSRLVSQMTSMHSTLSGKAT